MKIRYKFIDFIAGTRNYVKHLDCYEEKNLQFRYC